VPAVTRGWGLVGAVALILFVDYFLYGVVIPLTPHAPAGVKSEDQLGFLYATYAASVLVVTPFFGYLGDRLGARFMLLAGVGFAAATTLLFGIGDSFMTLMAARLCQGAASAAVWTSGLAVIAESYSTRRVEMIGYAFTGSTAGLVLGPIVGGGLDRLYGYETPFVLVGALVAVAGVTLLLVVPGGRNPSHAKIDIVKLLGNKQLIVAAFAVALAAFAWGIIEPLLPVELDRRGVKPEVVGLMFTAASILYGFMAPVVGWTSRRIAVKNVIVLGTVLMALTLPLVGAFDDVVLVGIALGLVNMSFAFMLNPAAAELANATECAGLSCYSTVYAVYNVAYSIGMLGTSAIATGVGHALGLAGALWSVSGVLVVSAFVLVIVIRGGRHVPGT
jgi:MFS transporter, DHA1 family, solute carrier family 18 (vesicular amine transporter), member 1/2